MRGTEQLATRMGPPEDEERARIRDVLENVARPRLCGSEGAQAVDRYVRGELERLGYEVRELPFTFSRVPGRWGVPAAGLLLIITGVLSAVEPEQGSVAEMVGVLETAPHKCLWRENEPHPGAQEQVRGRGIN